MIATIGDIVMQGGTTGITPVLVTPSTSKKQGIKKSKGGTWRFPPFVICCVVPEARKLHVCFASDAHRKSGVFSFGAALSPVES